MENVIFVIYNFHVSWQTRLILMKQKILNSAMEKIFMII